MAGGGEVAVTAGCESHRAEMGMGCLWGVPSMVPSQMGG